MEKTRDTTATARRNITFSFVVAVYNTGSYLEDMIASLQRQTFGFLDNCEVLLIDDGSTDGSDDVCKKLSEKYSQVSYIQQKHAGVSAARNKGLQLAQGTYISFLDSDDILSEDTVEKVHQFFQSHSSEIDIVAIKLQFFENRSGDHYLNYKFDTDRIVDITKDHEDILLSASSAFIKKESIDSLGVAFDPELIAGEDAKFIATILLRKKKYGVLKDPVYHYRKRETQDSAISKVHQQRSWYFESLTKGWMSVAESYESEFGYLPKYAQFMIMYDLQWRINKSNRIDLSKADVETYKNLLFSLLDKIEPDIINAQKHLSRKYKLFLTSRSYSKKPKEVYIDKDFRLMTGGQVIRDYKKGESRAKVNDVAEAEGSLHVHIQVTELLVAGMRLVAICENTELDLRQYAENDVVTQLFDLDVYRAGGYKLLIPTEKDEKEVELYLQYKDQSKQLSFTYDGNTLAAKSKILQVSKRHLSVHKNTRLKRALLTLKKNKSSR